MHSNEWTCVYSLHTEAGTFDPVRWNFWEETCGSSPQAHIYYYYYGRRYPSRAGITIHPSSSFFLSNQTTLVFQTAPRPSRKQRPEPPTSHHSLSASRKVIAGGHSLPFETTDDVPRNPVDAHTIPAGGLPNGLLRRLPHVWVIRPNSRNDRGIYIYV
jgi:hypothetical protein